MIKIKINGLEYILYSFSINYQYYTIEFEINGKGIYSFSNDTLDIEFAEFNKKVYVISFNCTMDMERNYTTNFVCRY